MRHVESRVKMQVLARIKAGKGVKCRFLWSPAVSLSQSCSGLPKTVNS